MAKLATAVHKPLDPNISFDDYSLEGMRKADAYVEGLRAKAVQKDPDDPNCDIKGVVLMFPVADGYAYYIVTNDKPLTVQNIPVGDAWAAAGVTIRGINKAYVLEQLRMEKRSWGARGVRIRGWAPGNG